MEKLKELIEELKTNEEKRKKVATTAILVAVGLGGYLFYKTKISQNYAFTSTTTTTSSAVVEHHNATTHRKTHTVHAIPKHKTQQQKHQEEQKHQEQRQKKEQRQKTKTTVSKPIPKPATAKKKSIQEQIKSQPQVQARYDILAGEDEKISKLNYLLKIKELQAQIAELNLKIAEKEKKLKELTQKKKNKVNNSEITALKRQLALLKQELESKRATYPAVPVPPVSLRVVAVICNGSVCKAVIKERGMQFVVKEGDVLPDGSRIIKVKQSGIVISKYGKEFFKPVELTVPVVQTQSQQSQFQIQPVRSQSQFKVPRNFQVPLIRR